LLIASDLNALSSVLAKIGLNPLDRVKVSLEPNTSTRYCHSRGPKRGQSRVEKNEVSILCAHP
jgi:hypothetical protein